MISDRVSGIHGGTDLVLTPTSIQKEFARLSADVSYPVSTELSAPYRESMHGV